MELQVVTYVERPDLDDRWDDTVGPVWPEFLLHDATVNELKEERDSVRELGLI